MTKTWTGIVLATLTLTAPTPGCSSSQEDEGTGGTTGTGGSPTVILDGGGVIPDPPDGTAACQSGACNYQAQDCSSGGSCLPTDTPPGSGDWPPKCFSPGTRAAGDSCVAWNECIAGYFCLGIGGTADGGVAPGVCHKLCCGGDWSACPDGESCIQQVYLVRPGGGDPMYANADVCAKVGGCDPLDPAACSDLPGRSCQIVDPTGNVACVPVGSAGAGEACSEKQPCKGGFACVADACRRLCKAVEGGGEPSCPPQEGTCIHFNRDPAGVGECTPI